MYIEPIQLQNYQYFKAMHNLELFEEEIEIYNSKMRLLNWLFNELKYHPKKLRKELIEKGQQLPLNF